MRDPLYLTRKAAERLRKELAEREAKRRELATAIGVAREHGDISENAEYDTAKDAQALNESRINQLHGKLTRVQIIEDLGLGDDRAYIGATVRVRDLDAGAERRITLLSAEEAEPDHDIISYQSPIGKGLLGREVGDEVEIETPGGTLRLEVLEITRELG
jgi:transcription elongation factor GreA